MEFVRLESVAHINPRCPRELDETQSVSFLAMASVSEEGQVLDEETRTLADTKKGYTYFERGDVLLAKITPCFENGKAAYLGNFKHQIGFGSTEFHVIRPIDGKLDPKYLFYLVWNDQFRFYGQKSMTGAAGQKRVSADFLKSFEIPLPPLPEQRRIAAILDKADAIRRKRQQAIRLTEEFLRSVFLDMFGDPVLNPKGWEVKKLGEIGSLDRGVSKHRPRNAPELLGGIHPLIQTGEVSNSGGYITAYKSTYSDLGLKQSKMWPAGTLCITIAANIARTGILTFDACFPDSVVGFSPNGYATTEYIQYWIGFLQKVLERNAPESAQKNINLAILRGLDISVPPIELQKKFTSTVKSALGMKGNQMLSNETSEDLFNSLVQRAFRGNL